MAPTASSLPHPTVRPACTGIGAPSPSAAACTSITASGIDNSSVAAAPTFASSPGFTQTQLKTKMEIPAVHPAITAIDASSLAAAACTPTAASSIETPSSVALVSTSRASSASSSPQNHVETEIKNERPLVRPAFMAIDAFPRADVPCTSTAASSIAPSSSGAADPGNSNCSRYAVFLNHFGEDVKKTFASHLYHRLKLEGIRTFLDQPELPKGKNFPDQIRDAIENALCHVAIFSPRYTESEWVLNELLHMRTTGVDIIPVFYKVDPGDLERASLTDGIYARGLQKLKNETTHDPVTHEEKQRFSTRTISDWITALHEVAKICGFKLDDYNGDEGILLEKVVEAVRKSIKETGLYVAKHPTGLDVKVKDFEDTVILQSGEAPVVGIVGICGIGKTTLAIELYNKKCFDYDRRYFLSDISENASKSSLCACQSELLKGLTQRDFHIGSVAEGIAMLKRQLSGCNTFIVLDGVDHASQLDAILPVVHVLGSHSLILITCRDRNVLTGSGVQNTSIYKLTGLDADYSRQLLCSHAFGHSHPLPGFESLVKKFSEACEGSPLSLKLSGEHVCGKNVRHWEDQFNTLQQTLLHDIRGRLKSSCDALLRHEIDVFFDTASFFVGERVDMAIRIWDALRLKGSMVFQNLVDKSLVEVDSEGKIKMNNPMRDWGREKAKSSGLPLRLWSRRQVDVLRQQSYRRTDVRVRGIRMRVDDDDTDSDDESAEMSCYRRSRHELFCKCAVKRCNSGTAMTDVKFLDAEGGQLKHILKSVHSSNPIWLRWLKCPHTTLPSWVPLRKLRVLELSGGYLQRLWQDISQAPLLLRELSVDSPLSKLPESLVQLKDLKRIVLKNNNLKSLPELFGNLKKLEQLDLSHSPYLQKLPNSFGDLTQLKHLNLSCCFSLQKLPNSFGSLRNLEHLNVSSSQSLQGLPNSFSDLTQLKYLDLSNSSSLQKLPNSFANLIQLEYLNLDDCLNLTVSREALPHISLSSIRLSHCTLI